MKISAKSVLSDRFIPQRSLSAPKNGFINNLTLSRLKNDNDGLEMLSKQSLSTRQISLAQSITTKQTGIRDFVQNTIPKSTISSNTIPTISPSSVYDAKEIVDDHYYNVLDVSKNELVAIGLSDKLFTSKPNDMIEYDLSTQRKRQSLLTCVKYSSSYQLLFTADQEGFTEVFDIQKSAAVRMFRPHSLRIGRIENHNTEPYIIFTGSKDYNIKIHDLRIKNTIVDTFKFQNAQVTGLALKDHLMATGYNNGKLTIWDVRIKKQMITLQNHKGAVKALSWCPWKQSTLVSGGGKKDTEIIVYNSSEQKIDAKIPSKNQISEICWRNSTRQMIYSESRIELQKRVGRIHISNYFNRRGKKVKFEEMEGRILGMKINPSSDDVLISVSGDGILAYWDLEKVEQKINALDVFESISCQ